MNTIFSFQKYILYLNTSILTSTLSILFILLVRSESVTEMDGESFDSGVYGRTEYSALGDMSNISNYQEGKDDKYWERRR